MVINIKGNIVKENQKVKDDINGIKVAIIKVNLKLVKDKDMEYGQMRMEQNIKANLQMIISMDVGSRYIKQVKNLKEYFNMVLKQMGNYITN